jgi:hypothetical protein
LPSLIDGFLISQKAVNQTLPTAPTTTPESNPVRRDFQLTTFCCCIRLVKTKDPCPNGSEAGTLQKPFGYFSFFAFCLSAGSDYV